LTVEETIAEPYSDPLSDISDSESSDTGTVDSNLPTKSVWKSLQSHLGDRSDSEPSNTDSSDSETLKLLMDGVNVTALLKLKNF
jgi:hypothetical protein